MPFDIDRLALPDAPLLLDLPAPWTHHHGSSWEKRAALVTHALDAFERGRWYEALLLIDPCCRMPVPAPEDLLLRSEILSRLGAEDLAHEDLDQAYAINPTIPAIQLRMLYRMWHRDEEVGALAGLAKRLLHPETSKDILRFCLVRVLDIASWSGAAFSSADHDGLGVDVLTERPQNISIKVAFESQSRVVSVQTGPLHPYAEVLGCAATIKLSWPGDAQVAHFSVPHTPLLWNKRVQARPRYQPRKPLDLSKPAHAEVDLPAPQGPVTVIVPVYDGLKPTERCIDALFADTATATPYRIVLVDDKGPDPRIAVLLEKALRRGLTLGRDVVLLRNAANLGFIGSVNAALAMFPSGPVVLLNADTVVPPGWLDRLAAGAGPGVATVTPLSNNGELTTMPRMFDGIAMNMGDVAAIDRLVNRQNPGLTVDMPNGIGFCLYITEEARAACGFLNDRDYSEGYLEEADFCLRAAEQGLRNICACDVFVGHEGGRSFKDRKRSLVVRNLGKLERRFPDVRSDTHRFITEDPLSEVRRRLQIGMLEARAFGFGDVLVAVGGDEAGIDDARLCAQAGYGIMPVIRLTPRPAGAGTLRFHLNSQGILAPADLDLDFADPAAVAPAIADLLSLFQVASLTFLDTEEASMPLFELPFLLGSGFDLRLTHAAFGQSPAQRRLLSAARRVSTLSPTLRDEARMLGRGDVILDHLPRLRPERTTTISTTGGTQPFAVAVLYEAGDASLRFLLLDTAKAALQQRIDLRFIFFGSPPDASLLATNIVVYAGRPDASAAASWFRLHGCRMTFCAIRSGSCEHPVQALLLEAPRPLIAFGRALTEPLDIDPHTIIQLGPDTSPSRLIEIVTNVMQG